MDNKKIQEIMVRNEKNLSKYASLSKDAIRLKPNEDDIRPSYFRDIDRIIHSLSFTRYIDKTQVFTHWHKRSNTLAVELPPPARGTGTLIPSVRRVVWAGKHQLGNAAWGASFPSERALPAGGFGSVHTPSP